MYYKTLSTNDNNIELLDNIFNIQYTNEDNDSKINKNLFLYVKNTKNLLNPILKDWSKYKHFTNPYEFICKYKIYNGTSELQPISRAFYKFVDIYNYFNIEQLIKTPHIKSFHLAEGPGGFIEALSFLRNNQKDEYIGMTLKQDVQPRHNKPPCWFRGSDFLKTHKNVKLEYCPSNTGDITSIENLLYCIQTYGNSIDIVTGDAGFDFSLDYDNQEINMFELLYAQIMFALVLQKHNGVFILKIFDIFESITTELIYILTLFYTNINICKPVTSRIANSEKYIVCTGFKLHSTVKYHQQIIDSFKQIHYCVKNNNIRKIKTILNNKIPINIMNELEELNVILGQQQIENIHNTISLINNSNNKSIIKKLYMKHIQLCMKWCEINKIPYKKNITTNMFE